MKPQSYETFTELLDARIQAHPERLAYHYLDGTTTQTLTYGELGTEIYRYASMLQEHNLFNERVLLIYPVGLEFMFAFYGCMLSGTIAIPASEPRRHKLDKSDLNRLLSIVKDSRPKAILTTAAIRDVMQSQLIDHLPDKTLLWLTEEIFSVGDPDRYQRSILKPDHLTFLQYTSGSTGSPKGVMISHRNLMANEAMLAECFGNGPDTVIVSWLPLFHDMGLICNMLQASYLGVPGIHMPPSAFIRQPILWLRAITEYGGTFSGGPNFAYDLCVRRIRDSRKSELDLRSWKAALNGSEPVRQSTLEAFAKAFASCGFNPKAMNPCYGLAEATVYASGYAKGTGYGLEYLRSTALAEDHLVRTANPEEGVPIVGCGFAVRGGRIRIVNPTTRKRCNADEVGEIWVHGNHIGQGYWEKPDVSRAIFRAQLQDSEDTDTYLRTGDLGFMRGEELFFTGRLKELIIIHGHNFYPQDIERTVEEAHPALRPHCGAAFSVNVHDQERLVVVFEVLRKFRDIHFEDVFQTVRTAIAEAHDLPTHAIVLIHPKTMPKTTSGKLQRRGCRAQYLDGSLSVLAQWQAPQADPQQTSNAEPIHDLLNIDQIAKSILLAIAELTHIPVHSIEPETPFIDLGLDSVGAITLMSMLSEQLHLELPPTLVYDYPNSAKLAACLAEHLEPSKSPLLSSSKPVRTTNNKEPIAVVGLGCRLPDAPNPHAFWEMLTTGINGIRDIPTQRSDLDVLRHSGKGSTQRGGFLSQVDQFDPQFFGIAPLEAEAMDPQHRLLLEVVWETLAAAGIQPEKLSGTQTGVYLGIANVDYARFPNPSKSAHGAYYGTGTAASIAANRLSYMLNLQGPSVAVDTACSSSLVALHFACNALRNRECDQALSGGVNLILTPDLTLTFDKAGMMSPTGSCKTFDASADGYVRGEGCGVVLLKRLSDARANGDRILAVIRGSAINQDGRSNGLTAPNGTIQQKVINAALEQAEVSPTDISYVETHGTGTPLGDPIEFGAIKAVLGKNRSKETPCWLGSVKTNIGHLEAAAGVAGLIKAILALNKKIIPPNLHFTQSNAHIDLEQTPFDVPKKPIDWHPTGGKKRLAGVSSFGFGGTNAHVILQEAEEVVLPSLEMEQIHHLVHLAAPRKEDLNIQTKVIAAYLRHHPKAKLSDVAFTLNRGKQDFDHRLVVTASSTQELARAFEAFGAGTDSDVDYCLQGPTGIEPAFLFSGQGTQYKQMGMELYRSQPIFRQAMEQCSELLEPHLGQSLTTLLYEHGADDEALNQTGLTQPALFSLEYALYKLWELYGVQPSAVMGHSLGEIVAAVVAGVFSLEDGLRLVAARGNLMQAQPSGGRMVSVFAAKSEVDDLLDADPNIAIAAYNGSKHLVLSGPAACIDHTLIQLAKKNIRTKDLSVSHAYHSAMMDPVLAPFRTIAESITYHQPRFAFFGNLHGGQVSNELTNPEYWVNHIRQPVRFAQGFRQLFESGHRHFVEVGPGSALLSMGRHCLTEVETEACQWLPSLRRGCSDWQMVSHTLGQLYLRGTHVDWHSLDRGMQRTLLPIPAYAWQKQRYWLPHTSLENRAEEAVPFADQLHPYLGKRTLSPAHLPNLHFWETTLNGKQFQYFNHHRIHENPVLPISAYLEMATAAATQIWKGASCQLGDLELHGPLFLRQNQIVHLQVVFETTSEHAAKFFAYARFGNNPTTAWTMFASAKVFKLEALNSSKTVSPQSPQPLIASVP